MGKLALDNRTMKLLLKYLLFLFTISYLQAQVQWERSGYISYLFNSAKLPISPNRIYENSLQLRLMNRFYINDDASIAFDVRTRAFHSQLKMITPGYKSQTISQYPMHNLEWVLYDKNKHFAYAQIDRLYWDYYWDDFQFILGRQRVAWGTSLVWNITDLFNPQSVLDFDYEEKPGSDAIRAIWFYDDLGQVEIVVLPSDKKEEQTAALLWQTNRWNYDFAFIAAWQNKEPVLASNFSGDIYGAGFRGEFKWTRSKALTGAQKPNSEHNMSAVLSLDYTFANSFYLHSEILYNSIGLTEGVAFKTNYATTNRLLTPAKNSLFFETAYNLHPLLRGSLFMFLNPDDGSKLFMPMFNWSAITNLDIAVIGIFTQGAQGDAWGPNAETIFLRSKFSF